MSHQLSTILSTTFALLDQFQDTLSPKSAAQAAQSTPKDADGLPLLSASSSALRAQVTKLSLLAITSPFTHSAVSGILRDVNDSILPSLVTASLLVTPTAYTEAFHSEILVLAKAVLVEFSSLIQEVKRIADKKDRQKSDNQKESELVQSEKNVVTVATGRAWDACDAVTNVANKGVVGFVIRRVEQWRDLVRDAVDEIEDWDPEEDGDDFFDGIMDDEDDKDDDENSEEDDEEDKGNTAALQEQKKATIRFLKPVAQIYPAIINNRLKNTGNTPLSSAPRIAKLESLMRNLQRIPDQVDEAAGALYEADVDRSVEYLKEVRKCATQAVDSVVSPWDASAGAEDKFTVWSKTWLKVMDEVSKPISSAMAHEQT
ncbi:hypothetical protein N7474_010588 [Penicillium riverlandense]|uniref:uncharacterized protein n=1 Tax=Penicillium riverlandense TaxID=1903569 RepID=UPI002548F6B1|nr:uncharacterized protein N7474_010588 [Penicillium riverlandense]KAJ5806996.1 hypothetical protein N7474_010588 [Penicillium riverlandense]